MAHKPFGFDAPKDSPGFLLWQTTISWQRQIKKALEPHGISHAQFVIVAILLWLHSQKKDVTQIDIVRVSRLDKMTVSKSLKKLISMNFATRHENQQDTRAKSVQLTKSGVILAHKLIPIIENIDITFFSQLKRSEERNLIIALQKLTAIKDIKKI